MPHVHAVVAKPSTTWSPLTAATPAKGWWDASDTATITEVSSKISQWDDKSGNGLHFVQSNSTYRPVKETDGTTGLNTIRSTAKFLQVADQAGIEVASSTDGFCWAIAVNISYFNSYGRLLTKDGTNNTQEYTIAANSDATNVYGYSNTGNAAFGAAAVSGRRVLILRYDKSYIEVRRDTGGTYTARTAWTDDVTQNGTNLLLGAGDTSGGYGGGFAIMECIWWNVDPGTTVISDCFTYLKNKWATT